MQFDSLSIVGVGLIGGSIGLAARQAGIVRRIVGVGRNIDSLKQARALGIIDEFTTEISSGVCAANLVVFCTPVDRIAAQVLDAAGHCRPGTLLTDAGSTKAGIVRDLEGRLPAGIHFVGSHPLAGSEKRGAEFARADLFQKRVTVITPTQQTDDKALSHIREFWESLGSNVHILDPESHDRALAITSHLPHLVASALAGILPAQDRPFAASGFRDTTRIAAGDPELWGAIFRENALALSEAIQRYSVRLEEYRHAVLNMDQTELLRLWTQGKQVREMLWEVEIHPLGRDVERERVCNEFDLLTHSQRGADLVNASARGFLLEGELNRHQAEQLQAELLADLLVESSTLNELKSATPVSSRLSITVLLKPGVMDPVAQSVLDAASDLGIPLAGVRTFRRYFGPSEIPAPDRDLLFRKILANDAIEQLVEGPIQTEHLGIGSVYHFRPITISIRNLDDAALEKLSREGQLALNLAEMQAIQSHFRDQGRDPTDIELETLAQTWSEHCSHKTLKGPIDYTESLDGKRVTRRIKNLLKETIFGATQELRKCWGADDWCISVFSDNAGVVKFDDQFHVCFKVETHNHPSAIEPYGGANTGIGGVIRDPLGTGMGAKPICNTDVFCFAPPDYPPEQLPAGVLHPRRVMQGVVSGVRDYGNRMGIPTVNGAVLFDERYLANPLVYCGTVGLIPVDLAFKKVNPGDLIVAVGGRTGRDGIHGATFSSLELTDVSETVSGGAVQIGNAITEKKTLDVILQARDRGLFSAITDCGAGGFSSAVGEMGAELGARVQLENAPLNAQG